MGMLYIVWLYVLLHCPVILIRVMLFVIWHYNVIVDEIYICTKHIILYFELLNVEGIWIKIG